MLYVVMKIIWRRKVLKIIALLCFISVIPYILIVGLEKTETTKGAGKQLLASISSNTSGKIRYSPINDKLPLYGETKDSVDKLNVRGRPHDVPMMVKYCNPPSKLRHGTEGTSPDGYQLRLVHVFIRHGDRTSMHEMHGYEPEEVSCKFGTWYNGSDPKVLQYAPTMAALAGKQPGRNHFLNWSLYPNKMRCDSSDLTSLGALQHIQNGQHFQERYINNTAELFDPKLALSSQIYVRSTEVSRTYQSSMALLYGFIPKLSAVHLNIDNTNNLFFCSSRTALKINCVCKHGKDLNHFAKKYKNDIISNRTHSSTIKSRLADIFDNTVQQIPWVSGVLDAFAAAMCHQLATPCSISNPDKCITDTLIKDMWDEAVTNDAAQTTDPNHYHLKYASVQLHPVMMEITRRMKDVIEGRPRERFVLYSGHDLTLSPLLLVLGLHDGVWPPYASRIVIEMFKNKGSGNYFLKFIYNGVDMTSDVIFCKGKTIDGLCEFKLFNDFVIKQMIHRFSYTSYNDACSRTMVT